MKVRYLIYAILLALPLTSRASQKVSCSIHAMTQATPAELAKLATFARKDAETIALANLNRKPGATVKSELKVERGCLVWAFDFKRAEKAGFIKVLVDAGDGRFLSERMESPQREAADHAKHH
ncbi:MAG: PepSY domain-containing protein [Betaproteobacteria bacterium]